MHKEVHDEVRAFVNERMGQLQNANIADIGAYDVNGNLRGLFARPGWTYTGFDLSPGPNVDVVLESETKWGNIPSDTYDVVVSVSTLEHTRMPWLVAAEIARIAKPGALICLTAPYAWPYHAHPIDCWRIFPDGMSALMESVGIEPLLTRAVPVRSDMSHGTWLGDTVGIGRRFGG
jgi:SAM-dependent methyltransferase